MKLLLPITEYRVHTLELFVLCCTSSLSRNPFSLSFRLSLPGFPAFESDALAPRPGRRGRVFQSPVGLTSSLSPWLLFRLLFADSRGRSERDALNLSTQTFISPFFFFLPFATAEMISKRDIC